VLAGVQLAMQVAAGYALALATVAGLLAAGVLLRQPWLVVLGALGVLLVTPQITTRYLPMSAATPMAIFVVGVVLLGSAVWLARRRAASAKRQARIGVLRHGWPNHVAGARTKNNPCRVGHGARITRGTGSGEVEVWLGDTLTGGAIGIGIGGVIGGDSLFGRHQGTARVAVADTAARLEEADGLLSRPGGAAGPPQPAPAQAGEPA
jgi:Leucyl/phenylalanyl-tRNA protein transferase